MPPGPITGMQETAEVVEIREFETARLESSLRHAIPDLSGPMRIERIRGGQSNPTFSVDFDDRRMVARAHA